MLEAYLATAETEDLLQRLLDLGIEHPEGYTEECQPQAGDTRRCVADAGQSVLRVRSRGGEQEQRYLGALEDVTDYCLYGTLLWLWIEDGRALALTAQEAK